MRIMIPVTASGGVDPRFGKAVRVAVVDAVGTAVDGWTEHEVGWDELHDVGTEGAHHARIVRFLRDEAITHVVCGHMGQGMVHTITKMGLPILTTAETTDARAAVDAALAYLAAQPGQPAEETPAQP